MAKGANDITQEIVGQRARWFHALLLKDDRLRFAVPDPDRQDAVPRGLAQQQHMLVGGLLNTNADNEYLSHR
jgi:hypothetical protein